jgi:thiamine kinase-like enzyme
VVEILQKLGIEGTAVPITTGHINKTYKVGQYIVQRINSNVFNVDAIANNLHLAKQHLAKHHPDYLFIAPLKNIVHEGEHWRIYPYLENSYTINDTQHVDEAYDAAKAFGRFGKLMQGVDISRFRPTIKSFHDLSRRYEQFQDALTSADNKERMIAAEAIQAAIKNKTLVDHYNSVIASNTLVPGVFHNDTKINNVLFDGATRKAIAVIDLDTVMEGYFIYDLGDLVRTLVSPVSEEEKDIDKIVVRKEFYDAVIDGYLSEMNVDTSLASFAGKMMTYIMALRFLADYLRGNTYYHVSYPDQNLVRARNQLRLLELL